MRSSWIRVGLKSNDECPYKRQKGRHRDTGYRRPCGGGGNWERPGRFSPGESTATKRLVICYNSHRKRIWLAMENVVRGQWCGLKGGGHTAGEDAVRLLSPAHVIDLSPGWA